jgi:hypothetical protein
VRGKPRTGEERSQVKAKKDPKRTRERCRQAARRLAARGELAIMQEGKVVDPSFAKGGFGIEVALKREVV